MDKLEENSHHVMINEFDYLDDCIDLDNAVVYLAILANIF
jgi:hypothetical protein